MYKIETPNKLYNGTTHGVRFENGVGYTDDKKVRDVLINDFKYKDATDYDEFQEQAEELGTTTKNTVEETTQANETLKEVADLEKLTVDELKEIAKNKGLTNYSRLKRDELIELIKNENDA